MTLALLVPGLGMGGDGAAGVAPTRVWAAARRPAWRRRAGRSAWRRRGGSIVTMLSSLEWFRGEDVSVEFTLSPVEDITGWTVVFKAARTEGGAAVISATASVTDAEAGEFTVSIAAASTASLTPGLYHWEARRTDSGSNAVLAAGELTLKLERAA